MGLVCWDAVGAQSISRAFVGSPRANRSSCNGSDFGVGQLRGSRAWSFDQLDAQMPFRKEGGVGGGNFQTCGGDLQTAGFACAMAARENDVTPERPPRPPASPDYGSESGSPGPERAKLPGLDALNWESPAEAVQGPSGRRYHERSFFCLSVSSAPRKACIRLVESWLFEPFILTVIICNVITMAMTSPLDPPGTSKEAFIAVG